jgi:hypothetical protein
MPPEPEREARKSIDALLIAAGWAVQDYAAFNPGAARGIALREAPLVEGRCDYLLMVDRAAVGIVAEVERRLSVVEELEVTVVADLQRNARLRLSLLQRVFQEPRKKL